MNEQHFAYKVRQHLNRGLHDLRPDTIERLAAAREAALVHRKQTATHPVLASAGSFFSFRFEGLHFSQIVAGVALLLCSVFSAFWVADQRVQELGDIDSAILSDELPIGAFTDKGFAAWLNSNSSE